MEAPGAATDVKEDYGGDLNDDLYEGLSQDFEFKGSYCHCSIEPDAPNPGLKIEGLGVIGLPLGERDALAIISKATQAPFGKGDETVVDTSVRDTWEIEPSAISFANRKWGSFMDESVTTSVWTTLGGITQHPTKPKCELYKLLLYKKGSHFLPHQDTEKSPGMFATIIVILPSEYEGGQVHLTHAGRTKVLDVSQDSLFNTSVLAWYTDVVHEVKPITSGYRLALSYNLIHTSPNIPRPSLPPSAGALDDLRDTLERWNANKYTKLMPSPPFFAYVLEHQYSKNDLNRGAQSLKGKDAHLVANLRQLFDELGIEMCLANLTKTNSGPAEIPRYRNRRGEGKKSRRRYVDSDNSDYGDWDVDLLELHSSVVKLSNFVRLTASGPLPLQARDFKIKEERAVVPRYELDAAEPDDQEYEGYMGNHPGTLEQIYRRSVLVLFKKVDETSIVMDLCGSTAVLKSFEPMKTPTPEILQVVARVLKEKPNSETATIVLSHALAWKDPEIWNQAIRFLKPIEAIQSAVTNAFKSFQFDTIKPGLASLIKRQRKLEISFNIIEGILPLLEEDVVDAWYDEISKEALAPYASGLVTDIPTLLILAQDGHASTICSSVIPRIQALPGKYDFLIELAISSVAQAKTLAEQVAASAGEPLLSIARSALVAAIAQLTSPLPTKPDDPYYGIRPYEALTPLAIKERVNSTAATALSIGDVALCVEVFNKAGAENQMEVLSAIRTSVGTDAPDWAKDLINTTLESYTTPAVSDAPTLAWIAGELGPEVVENLITEKIGKTAGFDVLIAFAKSLHERLLSVSQSPQTPEATKDSLLRAATQCLLSVVPRWEEGADLPNPNAYGAKDLPPPPPNEPNIKVKRVLEFVDLCFTIGDLSPCTALFANLKEIPRYTWVDRRFKELLAPLVPHLKQMMKRYDKGVDAEPFKTFFRNIVSLYLARVLGEKTPPTPPPVFPTTPVGDGCSSCTSLNKWLTTTQPTMAFEGSRHYLEHVESQIYDASHGIRHLVTTMLNDEWKPYTLDVKKNPEVVKLLNWSASKKAAVLFLRSVFESDGELSEVMGARCADVMEALQGTRVFVLDADTTPRPGSPPDTVHLGVPLYMPLRLRLTQPDSHTQTTLGVKRKSGD